jgi:hypothetical protein
LVFGLRGFQQGQLVIELRAPRGVLVVDGDVVGQLALLGRPAFVAGAVPFYEVGTEPRRG